MPRWLAKENPQGVPANALWLTNGMVQVFLLLTLVSKASYLALISLSTAMILVPYLFSALYALSLAWRGEGTATPLRRSDTPVAVMATGYCLWLLLAAGPKYLLLSALLYAPGAIVYLVARRQGGLLAFSGREQLMLVALLLLAVLAVYLLASGRLAL